MPAKTKPFSWWQREPKPWIGPESVERIRLAVNGPHVLIGEGYRKKAYLGFVYFKTPKGIVKKKVAIKKFTTTPLTDEAAQAYMRVIDYLRVKGFPLPKSGLYKTTEVDAKNSKGLFSPGEWVAIQQYFGNRKGSKIVDRKTEFVKALEKATLKSKGGLPAQVMPVEALFRRRKLERIQAVRFLTELANLGYSPRFDVVAPLRNTLHRGAIPFDLDLIADEVMEHKKPTNAELAVALLENIKLLTNNPAERKRLYNEAFFAANEGIKQNISHFKYLLVQKDENIPDEPMFPT